MPAVPWILGPGAKGTFRATVDIRGKEGKFGKAIFVTSNAGTQMLMVVVDIPEISPADRERNRQLASLDRQAVFTGKCAACHLEPIGGKMDGDLFQAACAICHISERRAQMVPDLLTARTPRDADFWRKWIAEGKENTMMPAFARKNGGPLTPEQVESLVAFALAALPTQPRKE